MLVSAGYTAQAKSFPERSREGARRPVSFGLAGSDGVCGLLPDGYHYSLDIWGQAYADIRFGVVCERFPPLEGLISHSAIGLQCLSSVRWTVLWGTQWGQMDSLGVLS
jgi:hypothetical protein